MKKTKKIKRLTLKQAKTKALKEFSLYIRQRDTEDGEIGRCFTCPKLLNWKQGHAGHFVQGRHTATLFLENNAHLQCPSCNIFKHGNLVEYTRRMIEQYGMKTVDMLRKLNNQVEKKTVNDYIELAKFYKNKREGLSN